MKLLYNNDILYITIIIIINNRSDSINNSNIEYTKKMLRRSRLDPEKLSIMFMHTIANTGLLYQYWYLDLPKKIMESGAKMEMNYSANTRLFF